MFLGKAAYRGDTDTFDGALSIALLLQDGCRFKVKASLKKDGGTCRFRGPATTKTSSAIQLYLGRSY